MFTVNGCNCKIISHSVIFCITPSITIPGDLIERPTVGSTRLGTEHKKTNSNTTVKLTQQWSILSLLLKKSTLDKDLLSYYRPISNLSVVSKIIERIVKSRLTDHLSSNSLLNPHQSAYCKHHSTETALSYIHDHLINAIGSQKFSCLCLLDLSAAFDTIDHNILITCLSS